MCPWDLGVDRYVFFRADTDTDYYRSSRPITDILNRYQVKSSRALLSFRYMCGHIAGRDVVPHRTTVLHKYRYTTRSKTV